MNHRGPLLCVCCLLLTLGLRADAQPTSKDSSQPATGEGEVASLLRRWYRAGTAAGNVGDYYDNRDGGHSPLNLKRHPQLRVLEYTPLDEQRRRNWGLRIRPAVGHVTFGNSSTASGDIDSGSNPKQAMLTAALAQALYEQYTHNNLYIYPEHRDHDPGRSGRGGYGDLFPANTPYVIISQGSSGSDRPSMHAVAYTLAAFRPEVKEALTQAGLLMPTVQMILRSSSRGVSAPEDYLTGKAHPTVFRSGDLDVPRMVRAAHAIGPDCLPPMAKLVVVEETEAVEGRDFFDSGRSEKLFDTPCAIARVGRSVQYRRKMVVSAADSVDPKGRPLSYHWKVLRGDEDLIRIRPMVPDASRVELQIDYHPRRPVAPGAEIESNRVDIGAFVHNGRYYSAPAFISVCWLDDEARTYDGSGRVLEVAYGVGDSTIGYPKQNLSIRDDRYDIADWSALLEIAANPAGGLPSEILRDRLGPVAVRLVQDAQRELAIAIREQEKRRAEYEAAEKESGASDRRVRRLRARLRDSEARASRLLTDAQSRLAGGGSLKRRLEDALNEIRRDVDLYPARSGELVALLSAAGDEARVKAFSAVRKALQDEGILSEAEDGGYRLNPWREGIAAPADRLTTYQRGRLEWLNVAVMEQILYPGVVRRPFRRNYINPHLATPKDWRDAYHYDAAGNLIGWTRFGDGEQTEFTALGTIVTESDQMGRPLLSQPVRYKIDVRARKPHGLTCVTESRTVRHGYRGPADRVGHVVREQGVSP
jgi:YD repeat-containing protein